MVDTFENGRLKEPIEPVRQAADGRQVLSSFASESMRASDNHSGSTDATAIGGSFSGDRFPNLTISSLDKNKANGLEQNKLLQTSQAYREIAEQSRVNSGDQGLQNHMDDAAEKAQKDITKFKELVKTASEGKIDSRESPAIRTADYDLKYAELIRAEALNPKKQEFWLPPNLAQRPVLSESDQTKLSDQSKNALLTPFQYRSLASAQAAEILAEHPELNGSLTGTRIVLNEGHFPDSPGNEAHRNNQADLKEYDLNKWSTTVLGEMLKLTGASLSFVDQSDSKDNAPQKERDMAWLGNKMKEEKPDVVLSIHHNERDVPGTFVLVNSSANGPESLRLAQAIESNAVKYGHEVPFEDPDDPAGSVGGIWDSQHSRTRGIQKVAIAAPIVLHEQFNMGTARAVDANAIADMQLGNFMGIRQFIQEK